MVNNLTISKIIGNYLYNFSDWVTSIQNGKVLYTMINFILIGRRIKETRKQKKISQATLAEIAGLSVSYISFVENAKRNVSLKSLVSIANAMDTTVDALLSGNINNGHADYYNEVLILMKDCNSFEKRVIFEQVCFLKSSLRNNRCLLSRYDI